MSADFSRNIYYGYLIRGNLTEAIDYVKQFPDQTQLYNRYLTVFGQGQCAVYEEDTWIDRILTVYQHYYRDVFYLGTDRENAAEKLRAGLAGLLGMGKKSVELCEMEQNQIADAFGTRGFHFLGGRTSGYYGPYIWRTTEQRTYEIELPDGIQVYTVKLLDGFIARSWLDYISFGEIGSSGWSDGDGIINCVRSAYDFDSEDFRVSLLKHEAQHARDLAAYKDMSSEDLEYRAKLVELIYSSERNLLGRFAQEADDLDRSNGHSAASSRIVEGFSRKWNLDRRGIGKLPVKQIQLAARELFEESNKNLQ